jgi:MFS family permease
MSSSSNVRHAFRALKHRNFQIFWAGQGISVAGTWMQTMAQSWLIYRLTDSALALGYLTAARFGPALVIAPFAGLAADRLPRRKVVIGTQATSLVLATALAVLTLGGWIRVSHILVLAFLQGCVDSLDMTVRQTFQMDLVGAEDLQSAVSLNSAAFNSGRMVGPALAGILVARLGEGWCFVINAASYLAVLTSLFFLRVTPVGQGAPRRSVTHDIAAGLRYAWGTPAIRRVMLAVAMTSAIGLSVNTITPALARDILNAGPRGYGAILAGAGVGAIMGALVAAGASTSTRAAMVNVVALLGMGLSLIGLGLARDLILAVVCMTLVGSMSAMQLSTSNTFLQTEAKPELRGRVVSLYVWIFQGLAPVGGFAAGWVAQHAGVPPAILGAGSLCLLAGGALSLVPAERSSTAHREQLEREPIGRRYTARGNAGGASDGRTGSP